MSSGHSSAPLTQSKIFQMGKYLIQTICWLWWWWVRCNVIRIKLSVDGDGGAIWSRGSSVIIYKNEHQGDNWSGNREGHNWVSSSSVGRWKKLRRIFEILHQISFSINFHCVNQLHLPQQNIFILTFQLYDHSNSRTVQYCVCMLSNYDDTKQ